MTILHVVATPDAVTGGGLIARTLQLCTALRARGARCAILTLDIGLDEARRRDFEGIALHVLPCVNRRFYVPRVTRSAIDAIVSGADVVELTGHWTLLNVLAWRAARRAGKPFLVRPAGALGLVGRSKGLKTIYNVAAGHRMVREAAGHVAVTDGEAAEFLAYGITADRLTVIPNGVDLPPDEPLDIAGFRARHGLTGRRTILFMGRLSHIKGPDLLLSAFADVAAAIPDYDLVLAGPDDGLQESLAREAAARGVDARVHFIGYVGGVDKELAYRAADFLALPSRREAMSLVALEAGARGRPVLLTDQCGFDDLERSGGGFVVPATAAALADGLLRMAREGGRLEMMGRALQDYVGQRYTWARAADAFLALCAAVVRDHGAPAR